MDYPIRKLRFDEVDAAVAVEASAMKGYGYLRDVSELFFSDEVGAMLGAFDGEQMVGIAKYTVLPDHTAWLETLRVNPTHQRRGIGRAMYVEFEKRSRALGVKSMGMYTGLKNIPSAALAREFGLETAGKYREFQLDLEGKSAPSSVAAFEPVGEEEAVALLSALREKYEGHLIFNRTFMPLDAANIAAAAREGKVLIDRASGSYMAFGNRFLEKRSVQIAMMAGDYQKCMDYAVKVGLDKGVPQVVTSVQLDDADLAAVVEGYGFHAVGELQVMSGPVQE